MNHRHPNQPDDHGTGEIYLEFQSFGPQVRVIAMDASTGIEVFVVGPRSASQADLQTLAVRKLKRRLEQEQTKPESRRPGILA